MIFRLRGKEIERRSALEVVRALELDDKDYLNGGAPIRQYLTWSINQLRGSVPARDLDMSCRLEDESLALAYLLLLDECNVGEIVATDGPKE